MVGWSWPRNHINFQSFQVVPVINFTSGDETGWLEKQGGKSWADEEKQLRNQQGELKMTRASCLVILSTQMRCDLSVHLKSNSKYATEHSKTIRQKSFCSSKATVSTVKKQQKMGKVFENQNLRRDYYPKHMKSLDNSKGRKHPSSITII